MVKVIRTSRWLVLFKSGGSAPFDSTAVDVRAKSHIAAIAAAKKAMPPQHPWTFATAIPWPRGCRDVDAAVARIA